jgi:hypothetical protein
MPTAHEMSLYGIIYVLVWITAVVLFFGLRASKREVRYKRLLQMHQINPDQAIEDADSEKETPRLR